MSAPLSIKETSDLLVLQKENSWLKNLVENSICCLAVVNTQGKFLFSNLNFTNLFESTFDKLMQMSLKDLFKVPQNYDSIIQALDVASKFGSLSAEFIASAPNGKSLYLLSKISSMKNAEGAVTGFVWTSVDTTEQREREEQLHIKTTELLEIRKQLQKEKELVEDQLTEVRKFKLAVESASDQIVITDADGVILYANAAITSITGFTPQEALGKKAGKLWGGLMDKDFYKKMWTTIKEEKTTFNSEVQNKRKNGEIYTSSISISPVLDDEKNVAYFVGMERDITREKEADKMRTEFISIASHQLRTPLSAMKWYLEMLLNGDAGALSSKQAEFVTTANQSNERMIALVSALLNISRIDSGRIMIDPQPTDLITLLEEVLTDLKVQVDQKKIKMGVKLNSKVTTLNIDSRLVSTALQNIVSNAVKYTPESGDVFIELMENANDVIFKVSDSGIGIPDDQKDNIFSKFFRADNALKISPDGTGLGLYLVKAVITSSGGNVWFESNHDHGTTFFIALPKTGSIARKGQVSLET